MIEGGGSKSIRVSYSRSYTEGLPSLDRLSFSVRLRFVIKESLTWTLAEASSSPAVEAETISAGEHLGKE